MLFYFAQRVKTIFSFFSSRSHSFRGIIKSVNFSVVPTLGGIMGIYCATKIRNCDTDCIKVKNKHHVLNYGVK
jgi:hypothetical protein